MRFTLVSVLSLALTASAAEQQQLKLDLPTTEVIMTADRTADASVTHSETLEHYGPPPDGCEKDEMAFQIQGIPGGICAAKCTNFMPCPKDLPDGVTAQPQCALKDQSGNTYCVLVCAPSSNSNLRVGDEQCGKATCQPVQGQGVGICTYS